MARLPIQKARSTHCCGAKPAWYATCCDGVRARAAFHRAQRVGRMALGVADKDDAAGPSPTLRVNVEDHHRLLCPPMKTSHPIRCQCGAFEAEVSDPELGTRAVCYCRDCQAFAHFLGLPKGMLDSLGGTDIVAVRPRTVTFRRGIENLACMSLSPKGTLRWYTSCCRTPIGNTPRDYRQSHVGLIHSCLELSGAGVDDSFGPVRMRVNVHGAKGKPDTSPRLAFALAVLRYLSSLAWSRLSGMYRVNPFFGPGGSPRVEPQVPGPSEKAALFSGVKTSSANPRSAEESG